MTSPLVCVCISSKLDQRGDSIIYGLAQGKGIESCRAMTTYHTSESHTNILILIREVYR